MWGGGGGVMELNMVFWEGRYLAGTCGEDGLFQWTEWRSGVGWLGMW